MNLIIIKVKIIINAKLNKKTYKKINLTYLLEDKPFIENKDRPQKFKRDFKFETEIKDDNPSLRKNKLASNIIKPAKVQLHRLKRNMK